MRVNDFRLKQWFVWNSVNSFRQLFIVRVDEFVLFLPGLSPNSFLDKTKQQNVQTTKIPPKAIPKKPKYVEKVPTLKAL